MKSYYPESNLSLSQLYQSEIKQVEPKEQMVREPINSGYKFKFDPGFSDRKLKEEKQFSSFLNNYQYKKPLKDLNQSLLKKSSIIQDYEQEIQQENKPKSFTSAQKIPNQILGQENQPQQKQIFSQNFNNQISFCSNPPLIGSGIISPIVEKLQFQPEDAEMLRFSYQFQKIHTANIIDANFKLSLYYYSPQIGITYCLQDDIIVTTIQQCEIKKINLILSDYEIDSLLVYYSINFPQQLIADLKQILQSAIKKLNFQEQSNYDIQETLNGVGYKNASIYDENLIDKKMYINLCSALPVITKQNLDSILNLLAENEKNCMLKFNDQLQNQLGLLKQANKQLSIQQLFEKHFSTPYAKKIFANYLKNPVSSQTVVMKRINYLTNFYQLSLQPSNQKFIKMPQKIGSFIQILKVLENYQEKSEPYSKLFSQLNILVEFIQAVKQLVILDRRSQQQTCQLLKDLSNQNLDHIIQLIEFLESSLLFNQPYVQIKEQKFPQLEQLLQQSVNLNNRIQLIKNKHLSELALMGIKPEFLEIQYAPIGYILVIKTQLNIIEKVTSLGWNQTSEKDTNNIMNFKTSYIQSLDEQFGNLEEQIVSMKENILIQIVKEILSYQEMLEKLEAIVGEIDYYIGLSIAITQLRLCIPKLNNKNEIAIQGGRHLLVEEVKKHNIEFQPNDFVLNDKRIFLIVGPNYSGKSVFMRQIGTIIYLIHCGLPVPAMSADIHLLEEIHAVFPCEGKSSNLSLTNQELMLLNSVLQVSSRSLVLMDEIGKNFKYQIGSNLHKSTLEYFSQFTPHPPIVLSATHYQNHEDLLTTRKVIQGEMEVVLESSKNLIFVYRINFHQKRVHQQSFGLEVALIVHQNEELYQRGLQLYELLTKYKYLQKNN